MPEFIMEGLDHAARAESLFVLGFIEAMFFTECGHVVSADEWHETEESERYQDGQLPCDVGYADLHPDSLKAIRADCEAWQAAHADLLALAYARDYDETQAGHDYWFTRNGHGVGFWDRKELECPGPVGTGLSIGQRLSDACRYQEVHVFFGDHVTHGDAPFVHVDL